MTSTGAEPAEVFRCPCGDPLLDALGALLEPTLRAAVEGELRHSEASELSSGCLAGRLMPDELMCNLPRAATLSRALYQRAVSWAIFSTEWLDAIAQLLISRGRRRVLEVAAGSGVLSEPMRRRGLVWRTTDVRPSREPRAEEAPEACDALTALARYGDETDVLVWSWWPRGDETDAALAEECARRRLPALFVGEAPGGCTGSDLLWERAPVVPLSRDGKGDARLDGDNPLAGVDVPCWLGMADRTWLVGASFL